MKMLIRMLIALLILPCLPGRSFAVQQPTAAKPHIVVILADDMGYGDLACNNPDSKIQTPHLDRLAAEGIRFTDAHSGGSSCIPSRYALMTGRFAIRASMSLAKGPLIEPDRMTVASMLREQGYATSMVGKWHLGFEPYLQNQQQPADYNQPLGGGPVDCGFDSFFGMHASLDLPPYFYIRDRSPVQPPTKNVTANSDVGGPAGWNKIQGAFWRAGKIAPDVQFDQVTPRLFDEAVKVINQHAAEKTERPLFLYLALPSPHTPWVPLEEFQGQSGAGSYGDFVMQVDAGTGRVMQALQDAGLDRDTLVLFSSDNGPVWYDKDVEKYGHRSVGPLRGMKFSSWEGGHRMPFLVRWPNRIEPGNVCDQTIVFSDVLATFAQLTGLKQIPAGMAEDSVSFFPYLTDPSQSPTARPPIIQDAQTIRDGDWKLILPKRGQQNKPAELYNLEADLSEQTNLYQQQPAVAQRLESRLKSFLSSARAKAVEIGNDLIPWKQFSKENLQASVNAGHWTLIDIEQMGIFQIQRGGHDYRISKRVLELIKTNGVDCYYWGLEQRERSDINATRKYLQTQMAKLDCDFGEESFATIVNFETKACHPIKRGTAYEVISILESIK